MRVLFVSAGTRAGEPAEVVRNQGDALLMTGISLKHFCVGRGGLRGYIAAIPRLRREIRQYRPDIVHAHYSLSAFITVFAGAKPVIASIMGSETNGGWFHRLMIRFFIRFFWDATVVKTHAMARQLHIDESCVIPNGVDTGRFMPLNREEAIAWCGFDKTKTNIIFVSNPGRYEKNWNLAETAVGMLSDKSIKLSVVTGIENQQLVYYYNAASVLLLTSRWEGSPNVIKEAMACNCPIVATDVGDIRFLLGDTPGTYLTSSDPVDVAAKLREAVRFAEENEKTTGRGYILGAGLDAASVSGRLYELYNRVLKTRKRG